MKAIAYTAAGVKATEVTLDASVFGVTPNPELIAMAYRVYLGNQRTNNAKTLTRGFVSGGGKKPWRQKGTGRARTGSIRNPIWRGGGITFGPTGLENYKREMPKKMSKVAVSQALSAKATDKAVIVVEKFNFDGKVASALKLLEKLAIEGNIVLVADKLTPEIDRSTRNIAGVTAISAANLNIFEAVNADVLVFSKSTLEELKTRFSAKKTPVGATK